MNNEAFAVQNESDSESLRIVAEQAMESIQIGREQYIRAKAICVRALENPMLNINEECQQLLEDVVGTLNEALSIRISCSEYVVCPTVIRAKETNLGPQELLSEFSWKTRYNAVKFLRSEREMVRLFSSDIARSVFEPLKVDSNNEHLVILQLRSDVVVSTAVGWNEGINLCSLKERGGIYQDHESEIENMWVLGQSPVNNEWKSWMNADPRFAAKRNGVHGAYIKGIVLFFRTEVCSHCVLVQNVMVSTNQDLTK